jgi:hypothetical protein
MCPDLHGQSIESRATGAGIPDIWFGPCGVECKYLRRFPVKPTTQVELDHPLTLEQFRWLNKRYWAGYPMWVVLQANRLEWMLFAAPDASVLMHGQYVPRLQLYTHAIRRWSPGDPMTTDQLQHYLKLTQPAIELLRGQK